MAAVEVGLARRITLLLMNHTVYQKYGATNFLKTEAVEENATPWDARGAAVETIILGTGNTGAVVKPAMIFMLFLRE